MTTLQAFIKKYSVPAYFALVFAISWGGSLAVIGLSGLPGTSEQVDKLLPAAVLALLAGPSVAGILLTGLVHGRAGLRDYRARLLRWRVGARWYAVALLTAPLLMTGLLFALALFSPQYLPGIIVADDKAALLLFGIPVALSAGIFEELGWTGFAIPELRRRYSVLTTGLIVGLLWAVWHLLFAYWLSGLVSGSLALVSYLLDPFLFLVLFRVLMVWVYDRTASILVAMLMHISLTASARILGAPGLAGVPLMTSDFLWAAALCILIMAVVAANRGQFLRRPLHQEMEAAGH